MKPGAYNLKIYRGVAFSVTFTFTQDDGTTPINLTGYAVFAEARKVPTGAVILDLEPEITDAAAGIVTISRTAAETLAMSPANLRWDLVLQPPSSERQGPYLAGLCDVVGINTYEAP